jgi:hypothetical protein
LVAAVTERDARRAHRQQAREADDPCPRGNESRHAIDISSCDSEVPAEQFGVLTADLDCSSNIEEGSYGVELGRNAGWTAWRYARAAARGRAATPTL